MPSQACGPDTPMWSFKDPYETSLPPSEPTDDETVERFINLWTSLPRTSELINKGIDRVQQKKTNEIFDTALSDLVTVTQNADKKELEETKKNAVSRSTRGSMLLDSNRFSHPSFTETEIYNDVDDFLESAPKAWAAEIKTYQADLQNKMKKRIDSMKPKIPKSIMTSDTKQEKVVDLKSVLMKTREIEQEALKQKISPERKKAIRARASEMDFWNRPINFVKTKTHSTPETRSATSMRDELMKKLSQETCKYLKKSEYELPQ